MANIKSAKKRILVINRRTAENKLIKKSLSTEIKRFRKDLELKNVESAEKSLPALVAQINEACTRGVIHKNNASRKVARLYLALNNAKLASVSTTATPVVEEKAEVKVETVTPAVEEKPAKKTAAKKTTKATKTEKTEVEEKPAKAAKKTTTKKTATKSAEEKPAKKTTATKKSTAKKTTKAE